jgi:enoyl-CoA hydratase
VTEQERAEGVEGVKVQIDAGVAVITVDRPSVRNAIGFTTVSELDAALDEVQASDAAVLVIRGGGDRAFISGGDLKELAAVRTHDDAVAMARLVRRMLDKVASFPLPVIAALNGHALGGGAEVAIAAGGRPWPGGSPRRLRAPRGQSSRSLPPRHRRRTRT